MGSVSRARKETLYALWQARVSSVGSGTMLIAGLLVPSA